MTSALAPRTQPQDNPSSSFVYITVFFLSFNNDLVDGIIQSLLE